MRLNPFFIAAFGLGATLWACSDPTVEPGSNPLHSPQLSSATSGSVGVTTSTGSGTGGAGGVGIGGATSSSMSASAGMGGATTTASSSVGAGGIGSGGGITGCAGGPVGSETLDKQGDANKILLKGMVVTPDTAFAGEVLVVGDTITCVGPGAACDSDPNAAAASVVTTNGIILPGLIDTHNHILFDAFDETDWTPSKIYTNHNQWTAEPRYGAMVDAKQYLNGEGSSPVDFNCELDKFGELKGLVAGTTSIVGAATPPSNKACYGTLARTIDQTPNGLPTDKVQVATLFPDQASADGVCANYTSNKTDAYLIHVGEGVDQTALNEFTKLGTITTTQMCLYAGDTTIVHGTALGDAQFATMAAAGMNLTWSPQSNVFLYGANTDLTKTTNIPLALSKGLNVSIAPDWSIGGSQNMLDELRFADKVDNTIWGNILTTKQLVQMATTHPAKALGLSSVLGSLAVGLKADIMVIDGDPNAPYDAVLAATPKEIRLVLVGGVPLYGDALLQPLGPAVPGCEEVGVCTRCKFMCVATTGGLPADKLGQTYSDIENALETGITGYDALKLTQWTFAPITPLVKCE